MGAIALGLFLILNLFLIIWLECQSKKHKRH